VGDDTAAGVGNDQVGDVGHLCGFGQQALKLKTAALGVHHAGPGAGFKGADQRAALFEQQAGRELLFAVDVLEGHEGKYRQQNGHRADEHPGRHAGPVFFWKEASGHSFI
jgi:hypothetical protein